MHGTMPEPNQWPILENQSDIDNFLQDNLKLAKPERQIVINEHTPKRRLHQSMI